MLDADARWQPRRLGRGRHHRDDRQVHGRALTTGTRTISAPCRSTIAELLHAWFHGPFPRHRSSRRTQAVKTIPMLEAITMRTPPLPAVRSSCCSR
ncbi:MAG: hypothetical protein MZV70_07910 [Desulfobacterales bacterium]|nr:hypothetical protein [Desulfobacterales bacterium]